MIALLLCQVIALEGATVHTMQPGQDPAPATVLVRDGEIEAVGIDLVIPEDARRIDLTGQHLVPGLIDGMGNHDPEHDTLHTAAGVLLLRDPGNDLERIVSARIATEGADMLGPSLWICGLVFDGQPPATTNAVVVRTPEEVTAKLEALIGWEIDYVGTHTGIPLDAWRALITEAHAAGLRVWGPAPNGASLQDIAAAGQNGLFFLDAFLPAAEDGVLTAEEIQSHCRLLATSGVAITPVLRAYSRYLVDGRDEDLALLSPIYEMQWKSERASRAKFSTDEWAANMQNRIDSQRRLLAAMHAAGVALVPGSGSPHPWLMPGLGLHNELAEWKQAGISDADLLQLATAGAADALGVSEQYGSIAPGMVANLVVAAGDPREDIAILREPAGIVLRGRWHSKADLKLWRESVLEYQASVRDALDAELVVAPPDLPEDAAMVLSGTAETRVFGIRTAVESYAVARQLDGKLAYGMRRRAPAGLGMADTETHLLQILDGDALQHFVLTVTSGGSEYRVTGNRVGGRFTVERRVDGQHIGTHPVSMTPALVDVGSALPAMILAKHRGAGTLNVLYFEGMDPAISKWSAELRDNGLFAVATPSGAMVVTLNADGSLGKSQRQRGNDLERSSSTKSTAYGGPGLALPADRVFKPAVKDAPAPEPAPKGPQVR